MSSCIHDRANLTRIRFTIRVHSPLLYMPLFPYRPMCLYSPIGLCLCALCPFRFVVRRSAAFYAMHLCNRAAHVTTRATAAMPGGGGNSLNLGVDP
jgi:hypothetical protein